MPPKQAKDQTKSTPTSKSANDKDMIKDLQKKVTNLEKEKRTWEQELEKKDKEIERLNTVQGLCGEADNVSTTPITNSRDLRVKKEDTSLGSQSSLSDIHLAVQTDDGSKQTNNNSRVTRSAPAANGTIGEGNIQDQSKEIKRLTEENKKLKEDCDKLTKENEKLREDHNKMFEDRQLIGKEFCRACKDIERKEGTRKEKDIKIRKERPKDESKTMQQPEVKKEDTSLGSQLSLLELKKQSDDQRLEIEKLTEENEQQRNEIQKLHAVEETNTKLNEKIKKLEETQSQKENDDSKQIGEKMKDINYLKERLYEAEKKDSDLEKQIEELQKTLEELQKTQSQEKERKEKPSADDKKNSDLTQEIKDLEKKLLRQEQESKEKLSGVEQEKTNLKREFEESLLQKEKENKSKLEEKDKENSKLSKTIDELQTDIAQLKQANTKLMEEKNKAVKEVDNLKNRLAEKDKEKSELTKTINDLQTEKEQLKKTNKSNSPKSAASRDLKDAEVKQLKESNEKLMEEKNKAVKEVDNLKNRLSQIAGSKLTDNNPGIADLSDPNRPLNLGEKFSELYDNQWTDAMEEMTCTVDEKQAIEILLRIVNDAYKFCVKISDGYCGQIEDVITKLFNTKLSSLQKKLTKDYRKSMAVYLVSDLEEEFCKTYKYDGESVKRYQKQCIRVCWFMAVQDPKVFIDVEDVSGKKFEDDKYKHYTKTGKVTDYLVWPVLYLHKGGPVVGKGVAQGK